MKESTLTGVSKESTRTKNQESLPTDESHNLGVERDDSFWSSNESALIGELSYLNDETLIMVRDDWVIKECDLIAQPIVCRKSQLILGELAVTGSLKIQFLQGV